MNWTDPNDFTGSDIEKIQAAVDAAREKGGFVRVGKRTGAPGDGRDFWLIDSAILLPSGTVFVLANAKIKLSDRSRDNFIRSANCVPGEKVLPAENIHIVGEGDAVFEGADHPRASGDGGKTLTIGRLDP